MLGAANLFIALKTVEQVDSTLNADEYLEEIASLAKVTAAELL